MIKEKGLEHVTVEDLVAEVTPKGRGRLQIFICKRNSKEWKKYRNYTNHTQGAVIMLNLIVRCIKSAKVNKKNTQVPTGSKDFTF